MKKIKLNLERKTVRSYEIFIGEEILDRMSMILAKSNWARKYVLVTDSRVEALHGQKVLETLRKADLRIEMLSVAPGEQTKEIGTVLSLAEQLSAFDADRQTALIALGGGVVGDLTGLLASLYMRGIPLIQVPTTLLAQTDSAIGGKTAVDAGRCKNLLGTIYQPKAVFIDVAFLRTLSESAFADGLAEVIKYGVIEDARLLDRVEAAARKGALREAAFLESIVSTACRIKKEIVELDEEDRGVRRILNFGHTIGHACEAASNYTLSHGEGVSIGMVAAERLSRRLHDLSEEDALRIETVIRAAGLPTRLPAGLAPEEILSRMDKDKKRENDAVHFVLLHRMGVPFVNGGVSQGIVREILEGMRA